MTDIQPIVERLGYHCEHPVSGKLVLRNPDGPEAADLIVSQSQKIERLIGALSDIREKARSATPEYRRRVGDWSGNDHDHLLIAALDNILGKCSHHLAGEPEANLTRNSVVDNVRSGEDR